VTRFGLAILIILFSSTGYIQSLSAEELVRCAVKSHCFPETKALTYDYKDITYYFCCNVCKKKFKENPEKYISKLPDDYPNCSEQNYSY